jgi:hypothetical protein
MPGFPREQRFQLDWGKQWAAQHECSRFSRPARLSACPNPSKKEHLPAQHFCDNARSEINRIRPIATGEGTRRNIVLHLDNSTHHTAIVSLDLLSLHRTRRPLQLPFPSDLAPSDFHLFGKLKTTLMISEFEMNGNCWIV